MFCGLRACVFFPPRDEVSSVSASRASRRVCFPPEIRLPPRFLELCLKVLQHLLHVPATTHVSCSSPWAFFPSSTLSALTDHLRRCPSPILIGVIGPPTLYPPSPFLSPLPPMHSFPLARSFFSSGSHYRSSPSLFSFLLHIL